MSSPIADQLVELAVHKATLNFLDEAPTIVAGLGYVPWSDVRDLLDMANHWEFEAVMTSGRMSVFIPVGGSDVELIAFDIEAAA